jgi:hypothetical protein
MGRVTIDAQGLPPVSFSRAPDAEDLGHPNKPAVRVSTPATAKSGGERVISSGERMGVCPSERDHDFEVHLVTAMKIAITKAPATRSRPHPVRGRPPESPVRGPASRLPIGHIRNVLRTGSLLSGYPTDWRSQVTVDGAPARGHPQSVGLTKGALIAAPEAMPSVGSRPCLSRWTRRTAARSNVTTCERHERTRRPAARPPRSVRTAKCRCCRG